MLPYKLLFLVTTCNAFVLSPSRTSPFRSNVSTSAVDTAMVLKATAGGYSRPGGQTRAGNGSNNKNREQQQQYKEKRLKDKMDRQLNKFLLMQQSDAVPSQTTCDNLLAICAASNQWDNYAMIVTKMKEQDLSPEKSTYRTILKECFSNGNGIGALKVLDEMQLQSHKIKPDQEDLGLAIMALCRNNKYENGLWKKALQLIHLAAAAIEQGDMEGSALSVDAYNEVLQCMEGDKRWEDGLELLGTMEEGTGFHALPNLATYDRVLNTLIAASQVEAAVELLLSMKERQVTPTIYSYEIVMSALLKKRERGRVNWQKSVELLDSMQEQKVAVPTVMYNRVISACGKARGGLGAARDIFLKMKALKVPRDTVTYNALISAAGNNGHTKDALTLFDLCKEDTGVDIITYTETIRYSMTVCNNYLLQFTCLSNTTPLYPHPPIQKGLRQS